MAVVIKTSTTTTPTLDSSSSSSPRTPSRGGFSSPWAQVVKDAGDSPEISQSPSSVDFPTTDGNVGKKPAWKKNVFSFLITLPPSSINPPSPLGGGGVMDGSLWPALSESTRVKSSSSSLAFDSSKFSSQASLPLSQVIQFCFYIYYIFEIFSFKTISCRDIVVLLIVIIKWCCLNFFIHGHDIF